MTNYPTLAHAPLVEALVDIQADLNSSLSVGFAEKFVEGMEDRFPHRQEMASLSTAFVSTEGGLHVNIPGNAVRTGYQFISEYRAVQCRNNGYTFSRLHGYDSWQPFISEGRELWNRYLRFAPVSMITRIALRYTNRISVPSGADYTDYFNTVPRVAAPIDQGLASFLMRLVLPQHDNIVAVVSLTTEPQVPDSSQSLVLFDIDVFRQGLSLLPGDEIWNICEVLRDIKNKIFFESTTDQARELFQ